jgi:hypothetical protein
MHLVGFITKKIVTDYFYTDISWQKNWVVLGEKKVFCVGELNRIIYSTCLSVHRFSFPVKEQENSWDSRGKGRKHTNKK